MPAKSAKQEKFMRAVAHSPSFAKKVGVPMSVGREFTKAGGGEMKESKAMMKKEVSFMKKKGAPKSMLKHEMKEAGMKKGGSTKKMAMGGKLPSRILGAMQAAQNPKPMTPSPGPSTPRPTNIPKERTGPGFSPTGVPLNRGPKRMAGGGLAAGHKSADGIAKKGKTRAEQVKMAKGGMAKKKYC